MKKDILSSEKMGVMPIGKLLASMSAPAMLSMFVQSLYNIVDSYFVSKLSSEAFQAVSIAFPMQLLVFAFAIGVGIGTNSLVARKLGEGKADEASATASTGLFLAIINAVIFALIGLIFSGPFVTLFSDNPEVISLGTTYLTIVTSCSAGMFVEILCSKTLQSTGNMTIPMISQLIGAILNIVLNPLLIFGYLFFPALGIAGSAVATVISQLTAMTFVIVMLTVKKHDVHLTLRGLKIVKQNIISIYEVGAPTIVMNAIASVTTTSLNFILMSFSEAAISILGIYFKLQSFVFMPVFGLIQGAMPIMGYNFGANKEKRFKYTFYLTLSVASVILVIGLIIFQAFPDKLLSVFDQNSDMGIYALRVISISFIPAAFGIVISSMFQSIGHGFKSLIMSLLRQMAILLPSAFIFGKLFKLNGVWFCYPVAEIVCALIFIPIAFKVIKDEFNRKKSFI
ncbi:putative MATE family efflux protein [Ruminiclostridium sufflavum DSM 19573]|uniref:Probable multidrug resistance protein NorM n=1 Tax=Ruminiclostridium sufflavum DSM 19573 TaxID=1121337 RepID=A0A318YBB4_9FIRM|nr:MATE family efflux transporter [Ruminiclostridium sufflavum]PYG89851.1 putative MATE family efflux protein [Ruminiclostridium sufflavum DSM 19573]